MKEENNKRVDCFKCVYFAVTWEPQLPRACKLYGFKSAEMPSLTVFRTTGSPCLGFTPKEGAPEKV